MSEEFASTNQTFFAIADELTIRDEMRSMYEGQLGMGLPDEDREEVLKKIAELDAQIEQITGDLVRKVDGLAHVLRRLSAEKDFIHDERDRLKQKELACERAEKHLREYTVRVMQQNGWNNLKTSLNTLFIRGSEAVEITDGGKLDPQFLIAEMKMPLSLWLSIMSTLQQFAPAAVAQDAALVRVKTEAAVGAIRKALKSGMDVDGADLALHSHLVCR